MKYCARAWKQGILVRHKLIVVTLVLGITGCPRPAQVDPLPVNVEPPDRAREAIDVQLDYLAKEQRMDGGWGTGKYQGNLAITSLGGLAFLSGGHRPGQGKFGDVLTKTINYVLSHENQETPGLFDGPMMQGSSNFIYHHAFTLLFLADAYDTILDNHLKLQSKEAIERAVSLNVRIQNKEGGWRYQLKPADADLLVTANQVIALQAVRTQGFEVPAVTLESAVAYIKRCQTVDGGFCYQPWSKVPGRLRTAVALTALNRSGLQWGEAMEKGQRFLFFPHQNELLPMEEEEERLFFYLSQYYKSKVAWLAGEKTWNEWYPAARDKLLGPPDEKRFDIRCPHYAAAISLIVFQTPLGHLSSMKR